MQTNLTYRIFRWLLHRIDAAREKEQQEIWHRVAVLQASVQISKEASIENLQGNPACITIGKNSYIRGRLLTYAHGGKISIGDDCYIGVRSEIWSMESILIGNRVLIAHDVNIHDGTAHSLNSVERYAHYRKILTTGHPQNKNELPGVYSAPIIIEDDVWISFGVTILKGVRIGRGSVIAAGSIVTKDVPEGVLYRNQIVPILSPIS